MKLYLPRARTEQPSVRPAAAAEQDHPKGNETVLIVEDDAKLRGVAVKIFRELGYHVLEADDAPSALAILEARAPIHLLFTDVVMPNGMTGYDLANLAKPRWPDLKILLTSGYSEVFVQQSHLADHNLQLIGKPYRKQDLAERVRDLLDRRA